MKSEELVMLDSWYEPAARCVVCGNDIGSGEGLTARYEDRLLRFKCPGCLSRFKADPEPYLSGRGPSCCEGGHRESPASEWRCD